jgi:ubiquitin-conjugating enzyme E2 R
MSGELAAERWSPAQRVESVLISILSLLDDAEVSSPANVDASVMLRSNTDKYKEMVKKDLERSLQDVPAGYVIPKHEDAWRRREEDNMYMTTDDWMDSDDEGSFGGSDSEMGMDDFDDEDEDEEAGSDADDMDDEEEDGTTKA